MREFLFAIIVDLMLFALNITVAILQRGTWIGWLCAIFVVWQCNHLIKFVKAI
jgi:hypothetical protein